MSQTQTQPQNTFLLHTLPIFTGTHLLPPSHILITSGLITSIAPGPPPASLLNLGIPVYEAPEGYTLIPGLIDSHIHSNDGNTASLEQSLRFGVTTVCDMHNEAVNVRKMTELANDPANKNKYADYKTCGTAATIEGGWPEPVVTAHDKSEETRHAISTWPKLKHPSDAAPYVAQQASLGASYIKLMHEPGTSLSSSFPTPSLELQSALVAAAHAHNLPAVVHALNLQSTLEALRFGADGLTHTFFDAAPTDELVQLYLRNKAHVTPTLGAIGSLTEEGKALQAAYAADPLAQRLLLSTSARENLERCMCMGKAGGSVAHAYASVRALREAGVPIVAGSDAAGPALGTAYGLSLHQELRLLVRECGLRGWEAVGAATAVTAGRFGFGDRGVLEVGKRADLVLVGGDVVGGLEGAEEEKLLLDLKGVWREGVVVGVWEGDVEGLRVE